MNVRTPTAYWMAALLLAAPLAHAIETIEPGAGRGAATGDAADSAKTTPAFNVSQSLARFRGARGPLRLEGVEAEQRLSLPLSSRLDVERATLRVVARNSTAVIEAVSSLSVLLNGHTVAQLPLRKEQAAMVADVELPIRLLKSGYNDLRFRAVQHFTDKCERPRSPELWTEIDLVQSHVSLRASNRAVDVGVAELDTLFDARLWQPVPLTVVAVTPTTDDAFLEAAAVVAQGVALRYRFHPLAVSQTFARPNGGPAAPDAAFPGLDTAALAVSDAVLLGTKAQLRPFVAPGIHAAIADSFYAVYPNDADPTRAIVVVSGQDTAGVTKAARAFALARGVPYPGSRTMQPRTVETPALSSYSRANGIYPEGTYTFRELGFDDVVTAEEPIELELMLPPDLFGRDDAQVEMHLDFAYSAGLRDDSSVEVLLNGLLSRPIRLSSPEGASFTDYVVSIPLKSFRPGRNVVSFAPKLRGLHEGECERPSAGTLTLRAGSTLVMPKAGHYTRLPDLARFGESLFPVGVQADGNDLVIKVAGADEDTVSAVLTLLAKFAQVQRYPLLAAQVTRGEPAAGRHVVVLGALDAVPKEDLRGAPLGLDDPAVVHYPTGLRLAEFGPEPSGQWRGLASTGVNLRPIRGAQASVSMPRDLGDWGLVMQYRGGSADGSTVLVTAGSPALLRERVGSLVSFEVWDGLTGDTVFWLGPEQLVAGEFGEAWFVGEIDTTQKLAYWFTHYPWWWFALVVGALLLTALLIRSAIVRRRRTVHAHVQEDKEY